MRQWQWILTFFFLWCVDTHFADFSDSDRLERFFDSEDEEFEILSLWGTYEQWFTVLDSRREIHCLFSVSEGKPEGMNIIWRPLQPVQLRWCSQCVSHSVPFNSLWLLSVSNIETCLVEAVAGAQDKFCMHIFTYMCFHLSLNTLNVYSEVIWCLSLTP